MSQLDDDLDDCLANLEDPEHDFVLFEDFAETLPLLRVLVRQKKKVVGKPILLKKDYGARK